MERTLIDALHGSINTEVLLKGWVDIRRDHGKLVFFDFRDRSGKVQMVVLPNHKEAHTLAQTIRPEWVLSITGTVNQRPERMVNKDEKNGDIEIEVLSITVLNESKTPPFDISGDGKDINEERRLEYRYLDLRRPRLQKNIRMRHRVATLIRNELSAQDFIEIETPLLSKTTPEGSRDYIVPSRLYQGTFYALPQSPQQYKQLLMTAGFERYFQFARCMRDEDTRGDRQPEFTQLDLEMSFPTREEIMALNEQLLIKIVQTLYPHKIIQEVPFPRLTYKEAMETYGSDKPDLRQDKENPNLLAFCWIIDFPFFERADDGSWTFTHNPFSAPKDEHTTWLMEKQHIAEILTSQYDIALNGFEIGGGSIRNHEPAALKKVFEIMGYTEEEIEHDFHHMLEAFSLGTPPHGGIAWGFDRLMAILENEPNIREVIAFSKTGEGRDLMMQSPSDVTTEQLLELGISIKKPEKK